MTNVNNLYTWSDKEFSLLEFTETHEADLPLVVQVTDGWLAESEAESFASGEVIRIHQCESQTRLVGTDHRGRHISIPENYPAKMRVIDKGKKGLLTIKQISEKGMLPLKVCFADEDAIELTVGNNKDRKSFRKFGDITLLHKYKERFLKGNFVTPLEVYRTILVVPLYLMFRVCIATGLKSKPESDWRVLQQDYARIVHDFLDFTGSGINDILIYDPKLIQQAKQRRPTSKRSSSATVLEENIYEMLIPSEYLQKSDQNDETYTTIVPGKESSPEGQKKPPPPPLPPRNVLFGVPSKNTSSIKESGISVKEHKLRDMSLTTCESPPVLPGRRDIKLPEASLDQNELDIASLTVDDVAEKLEALGLGGFREQFREEQIDGQLLQCLDESTLTDTFGMNKLHAKKIILFASTGWLPERAKQQKKDTQTSF